MKLFISICCFTITVEKKYIFYKFHDILIRFSIVYCAKKFQSHNKEDDKDTESHISGKMEKEQNNNVKLQEEYTSKNNSYKVKIATLEAELVNRDREIQGLRAAIAKISEYGNLRGQTCFKIPENEDDEDTAVISARHYMV